MNLSTEVQADSVKPKRRLARTLVVTVLLLGLGAMNILTLINGQIHDAGYGVIRAILSSSVGDVVLSRILSSSPTANRRKDVATATKVLSDEKSILSASNRSLVEKHAVLEKSQKEVVAKNAELTRTSAARAVTVKKFSNRLATRSVVNATRNLSSIAAEAVPIVGVAVVIGVTAWDLYDACETLKDVNELNTAFGHQQEDSSKVCGMKVPTIKQVMDQVRSKPSTSGGIETLPPTKSQ